MPCRTAAWRPAWSIRERQPCPRFAMAGAVTNAADGRRSRRGDQRTGAGAADQGNHAWISRGLHDRGQRAGLAIAGVADSVLIEKPFVPAQLVTVISQLLDSDASSHMPRFEKE